MCSLPALKKVLIASSLDNSQHPKPLTPARLGSNFLSVSTTAPRPAPAPWALPGPVAEADAAVTYGAAPEYLEHARRNAVGEDQQPDLPWEA